MKKLLFLASMMMLSMGAFAQFAPGTLSIQPKVGLNVANLSDLDNTDPRLGVVVGAELEYQLTDLLSLSAGALYSMQGCKSDNGISLFGIDVNTKTTTKTDYLATVCDGVDWERMAIVVVKIEAEFIAQIKPDSHIAGRTRTIKLGNKSFQLEQEVIDIDTQEVKSRCLSVMVAYDLERQQAIPLPEEWRQAISSYDEL